MNRGKTTVSTMNPQATNIFEIIGRGYAPNVGSLNSNTYD